jgi:hypothetical protein
LIYRSEIAENKYLYGTAVEKNKEIGICDGYKDYLYCWIDIFITLNIHAII